MTAGRGRVVKANTVAARAPSVPWEPRAPLDPGPPAELEVVREQGAVVAITLRCRCGLTHEVELVPGKEPTTR